MDSHQKHPGLFIPILTLFFLAIQVRAAVTLTDLGTLIGGAASAACAINNRGEIVGWVDAADQSVHAFYCHNGALINLDGTGDSQSVATAINDAGQIVGNYMLPFTNETISTFVSQAILYTDSSPIILNPGTNYSEALGINNRGQIVGGFALTNGEFHAFVYQNGRLTDLGTLGGDYSEASGINERGDIVGASRSNGHGSVYPFLYRHGQMQNLGSLIGDTNYSSATAINNSDEIVGCLATAPAENMHSFLYRHGQMRDIGTLGGTNSPNYAAAINNAGQIVGVTSAPDGTSHAFLWQSGVMTDLNRLVHLTTTNGPAGFLLLNNANGINDRGQIVGSGDYWNGEEISARAWLLDTSPRRIGRR